MSDLENRYVADVIADYKKGLTIPRANCDVPMLLDEIERLQARVDADERMVRNCKGAVVLAKEWIAEKDAKIERLNELVVLQKKDMKVAMDRVAELEGALQKIAMTPPVHPL